MSFFMKYEKFKILSTLFVVFSVFSAIRTDSITNLVDFPLKMSAKSSIINATLIDVNGAKKYFIQESISASGPNIKGKIEVTGEKDSYNIYYNVASDTGVDIKRRLVIHGTNCASFIYTNSWDQTLPGINKPLMNSILLIGPSILYRFGHSSLVWKSIESKNIRGYVIKGATTVINKQLSVTYYYKNHFDDTSGIENPSRIEFRIGYDPISSSYEYKENLILDIYFRNENSVDQLKYKVQPSPGIGCPHYLSAGRPLPDLRNAYLHYTMNEHIQGSNDARLSEIHVSSAENSLTRIKSRLGDETLTTIYDYILGVSFLIRQPGSCFLNPIESKSHGIDSYGHFHMKNLFFIDKIFVYMYLGQINMEQRSGLLVDVWETVQYNVSVIGKTADKAVITQYFVPARHQDIFYGYTLVSTTVTIYKLDSSEKTYKLTDKITRDYMNFERAGSADEFNHPFSLKKCQAFLSNKTLTLNFKLSCQSNDNYACPGFTESRVHKLKDHLMQQVIFSKKITPLRIDNVEHQFTDTQVEVKVTFLDSFDIRYAFNTQLMSVGSQTFEKMKKIEAKSVNDCLDKLSRTQNSISVVIYRSEGNICGALIHLEDFDEDTKHGVLCSVTYLPLHNLYRIKQELPLDTIHDTFLKIVGNRFLLFDEGSPLPFEIVDVVDVTPSKAESAYSLVDESRTESKLKKDGELTVIVPNVKTFGDCYRACHDSEHILCNIFSFCQIDGSVDCRVSSLSQELYNESHVEQDKACSIYNLNVLDNYSKVPNRKFKMQTSISMKAILNTCAESCHASPDCFSFQWCDLTCSFSGFYTDSNTEYDQQCNIFIPKVSKKYQKTGNKIVSDVIFTETKLTFEQCASLCSGWADGDTGCKSFNYCPKSRTESSCSLTSFSVKSSDTKTIEGGDCSNYELNEESYGKKRKESGSTEVTKGTSGTGAFGIIMLSLFVGALLGFAAPLGYKKLKNAKA